MDSETLMDHFVVGKLAADVPTYLMNHSDPSGHGFLALGRRPIPTHGLWPKTLKEAERFCTVFFEMWS